MAMGRGTALLLVAAHAISPRVTAVTLCMHAIGEPQHSPVTTAYPQTSLTRQGRSAKHHQELMANGKPSLLSPEGTCFSH